MLLTETEKAYLAGLMDGEGHIGITVAKLRPNGEWRTHVVIVTLASTDIPLLRWVQSMLPNGTLVVRKQPKQQMPIGNLRWSSAAAANVLRLLVPYLRIKVRQAELAIQFADEMANRGEWRAKPITPVEWERREDLRLAIREINRTGQNLERLPFPVRYETVCRLCGAAFDRAGTNRIYCSLRCQRKSRWCRQKEQQAL